MSWLCLLCAASRCCRLDSLDWSDRADCRAYGPELLLAVAVDRELVDCLGDLGGRSSVSSHLPGVCGGLLRSEGAREDWRHGGAVSRPRVAGSWLISNPPDDDDPSVGTLCRAALVGAPLGAGACVAWLLDPDEAATPILSSGGRSRGLHCCPRDFLVGCAVAELLLDAVCCCC